MKTTTAAKIKDDDLLIHKDMEEYSGWGWVEHVHWVADLSDLDKVELVLLVGQGKAILTNEDVSSVWLLSSIHYKAKAKLLYVEA